jgi:hypothetical protein
LFPELEVWRFCSSKSIKLSDLSALPTLCVLSGEHVTLTFSQVNVTSKLQFISLYEDLSAKVQVSVATRHGIFVDLLRNRSERIFDSTKLMNFQYPAAQRVLSGPWTIRHVDTLVRGPIPEPVVTPPANCNLVAAVDGVAGAIVESVIGDWLGVGTEFVDGSIAKC